MLLRGLGGGARHVAVSERSDAARGPDSTRRRVDAHHYNHHVSILIPECGMVPPAITAICKSLENYYLMKQLPLHELLAPEFINTFVKKGKCYALSYNTRIDEDNTVALLPTGKLILSVDKDTYQEMGLEGQPSKYSHRTVMRYIVTVHLSEASFVPGGKRYDRVMWALREKKPLIFDLLMSCDSSGGREESLASYFTQYQCQAYQPKLSTRILNGTPCPVLLSSELDGKDSESCNSLEFLDWLGAVFCDIDCNNQADSFLSTYCCPEPNTVVDKACLCTITGFIIPEGINRLLDQLRLYFEEPKLAQWLSMTVHGFADSPVSWGQSEHGYHRGGENLYNVVLFSNQDRWLHMAVGTQSDCPP
ncbi:ribonuclease P protein subunit p40 isoform X2 [Leucoraja erinacea]|uniref:ribonuclease P protein subunit p40 isoform X2 n=1 Tax=Leucoraja erinaceus TaxID=7782 RepID=UPI002455BEC4|nr:ribonuclease P protein subunit p40 isoform X2 [Leucoraja erinacea]